MILSGKTKSCLSENPGRRIRNGLLKAKKYKKQIAALLLIAGTAWYISIFWYQLVLIQGDSMNPAYHDGQIVILNKQWKKLQAGDVIAFQCEKLDSILIKRVAGLPGDTVQIVDGVWYRNGFPETGVVPAQSIEYAGSATAPLVLAEDEYFVLGDNTQYSKDSRYEEVGRVKQETIIGKVIR